MSANAGEVFGAGLPEAPLSNPDIMINGERVGDELADRR